MINKDIFSIIEILKNSIDDFDKDIKLFEKIIKQVLTEEKNKCDSNNN